MSVVDPLPAGAFTLTGKTSGPAVNLGRNRYSKSQMMYFHLDEIRDAVVRAGWHTEHDYQILLADHSALRDLLADADAKIAEYEDKIDALERALGWKPTGETKHGDGENRERDVQEGRPASVARSSAGAKDSGGKAGGGKGRKVRAKSAEAG